MWYAVQAILQVVVIMQFHDENRERVVGYQSRQTKLEENKFPVHDKELLGMCYELIKFRIHLLGERTFALYTDHASLRTAMKSPHLSFFLFRVQLRRVLQSRQN